MRVLVCRELSSALYVSSSTVALFVAMSLENGLIWYAYWRDACRTAAAQERRHEAQSGRRGSRRQALDKR
jgi:hypothetical protein